MTEATATQSVRRAYVSNANRLALAALPRTPLLSGDTPIHKRRACRYAARAAMRISPQTLGFEACRAAPDWVFWSYAERDRLGLLTGVSILSARLASQLDGKILRRVSDWTGEAALSALLDTPAGAAGEIPSGLSETGLRSLGFAAMRALLPGPDALSWLLKLESETDAPLIGEFHEPRLHVERAADIVSAEKAQGA